MASAPAATAARPKAPKKPREPRTARRTTPPRPPREARPRRRSPRARRWSESRAGSRQGRHAGDRPPCNSRAASSASVSTSMGHQIRLVLKAAAEFVAISRLEMAIEVEVAQNALSVNDRLRRAEKQSRSRRAQVRKRLIDAVIDHGLEQSDCRIAAAVGLERLLRVAFGPEEFGETAAQGRADDPATVPQQAGGFDPSDSSARRKHPTMPSAGSVSVPSRSTRSALCRFGVIIGVPACANGRRRPMRNDVAEDG